MTRVNIMKVLHFQTIISILFENFEERTVILAVLCPYSPLVPQINADSASNLSWGCWIKLLIISRRKVIGNILFQHWFWGRGGSKCTTQPKLRLFLQNSQILWKWLSESAKLSWWIHESSSNIISNYPIKFITPG